MNIILLSYVYFLKIISYSVGCHVIWITASFIWWKLLSFMRFQLSIVDLSASECLWVDGYFQLSFLWCSVYLFMLRTMWSWILYRGWIWICLHSSTCRHPVWPALFVRDTVFSQVYSWLPYQKSTVHRCVDFCLVIQFSFIDEFVCFYAKTIRFL